jgi:hypothetical protein
VKLFNGKNMDIRKLGAGIFAAAVVGTVAAIPSAQAAPTATVQPSPNTVGTNQLINGGTYGWDMADNTIPWLKLGSQLRGEIRAANVKAPNAIASTTQIAPGAVDYTDLNAALKAKVDKVGTPGVTDLEADSPYPSATQLGDFPGNGANSTVKFLGDEGKNLQRAWVQCAEGKFAIGGGFQRGDEAQSSIKNLQIVTSAATQIVDGKEVYNPIDGDKAGSVKPNAWLVEGFNNGSVDLIVRPSVVCAKTS